MARNGLKRKKKNNKKKKKKKKKKEEDEKKKKKKKILSGGGGGGGCDTYEEVIYGKERDWLQTRLQAGFILHNVTHNNIDLVVV